MPADRTLITLVREHLDDWRRAEGWSREALVQQIVEAHERDGLDRLTDIVFEPPGKRDVYATMKVNAERVYRWLDDHGKDNNLLPANFLWSILAAMPINRRQALGWALLAPVELCVVEVDPADDASDQTVIMHFQAVVASGAESQVALASMLDGVDPGEPERAHAKLGGALSALRRALGAVGRMIKRKPGGRP